MVHRLKQDQAVDAVLTGNDQVTGQLCTMYGKTGHSHQRLGKSLLECGRAHG